MFNAKLKNELAAERARVLQSEALNHAMHGHLPMIEFTPEGHILDASPLFLSTVGYRGSTMPSSVEKRTLTPPPIGNSGGSWPMATVSRVPSSESASTARKFGWKQPTSRSARMARSTKSLKSPPM